MLIYSIQNRPAWRRSTIIRRTLKTGSKLSLDLTEPARVTFILLRRLKTTVVLVIVSQGQCHAFSIDLRGCVIS